MAALYRNPMEDATAHGRPIGYGDAKKMLLEKINAYFGPVPREAQATGGRSRSTSRRCCAGGAQQARAEAQKTMELVRKAVGLS